MAASFSRPDPSSPTSVAEAAFTTSRRGYSTDEVRSFLKSVAAEMDRMQQRVRLLEDQLLEDRTATPDLVELDDETIAKALGEETLRVLHTARESASEIKIRAEESAARTVREAADEANRLRQDAEVEAARKRQDASADSEAELALAKQQGREMVNEARAYRERVLADLERRTTLARHQIEELLHGRDRLLQVFERARLVAVDVTSGLQAIDGPEQLVNLAPTTGPLPLMVPHERPRSMAAVGDEAATSAEPADGSTDIDHATSDATTAIFDHEDEFPEFTEDGVAEDSDVDADADEDDDGDMALDVDEASDDGDDLVADLTDASGRETASDANVVSLFRGRSQHPVNAGVTETASEGPTERPSESTHDADADEAERPRDVGGIFERLRHEVDDGSAPTSPRRLEAEGDTAVEAPASPVDAPDAHDGLDADQVDAPASTFSRRDEKLVPLIVSAARKLKRVLADEQNGVLDTLRQRDPVVALDQLVLHAEDHAVAYLEAISDELLDAGVAGAIEVGVKDSKTLRRRLVSTGAIDRAHGLVRSNLIVPLRDRLDRAIKDGDRDNEEITKRVRAVYREWKTHHIDDQLDDVFRYAHGGGLFGVIEAGTPVCWVIDPSEPACPDCEDNSLAGSVHAGDQFPTGHTSAPAHPGCCCMTLPESQ